MPAQANPTLVPMPTFMSVFGDKDNKAHAPAPTAKPGSAHASAVARPASSGNVATGSGSSLEPFSAFYPHCDSTSTLTSESADSSPTTTISTMDSASLTDSSPGPSPESPSGKIPPSSFVADLRSRRSDSHAHDMPSNTFFELQRPTTPAKKPRNLKNLGINTANSLSNLRINTIAPAPPAPKEKTLSAPASPAFIKPPTPPKRRPSNLGLTLQTPANNDCKPARLIIPATPAVNRPALRHFQSSPSLPLCSPSAAPSGGMRFPPLRKPHPRGFAEIPMEMEEDQEPNFDVPQSREEKPAAYPNGPICIYESGVYLFFEPTAEQASQFDVIINVASEVKNPFMSPSTDTLEELNARRHDERPRLKSSESGDPSSPTTPKATPVSGQASANMPEYIHMQWEHNTDIVPDLHRLVKTIDDRVHQGKRILVHCQCGVSRSASLIVAYGLYKNPGISVQEAYDAVKKRSKWIGPNMNLIMQLQEFRNGLAEKTNQAYGLGLARKSAGLPTSRSTKAPFSPTEPPVVEKATTPRTAPLPDDGPANAALQHANTASESYIAQAPSSAPSGALFSPGFRRSWGAEQTSFDMSPVGDAMPTATSYVDPKGHVVSVLSLSPNGPCPASLQPPRAQGPGLSRSVTSPVQETAGATEVLSTSRSSSALPQQAGGLLHRESPPMSPRSTGLCTTGMERPVFKRSFDVFSTPSSSELASPVATEFPKDAFPRIDTSTMEEVASPRATEFHMTPLKPRVADEDPFGLTSPRKLEFTGDPFAAADAPSAAVAQPQKQRLTVQAIAPPPHLAQPHGFGGFASLNGSAHSTPAPPTILPALHLTAAERVDSMGAAPEHSRTASNTPGGTPPRSDRKHLSTPPQRASIRTRFSSPNLRDQRKLHKIQTAIEARLPTKPCGARVSAMDDLDALMSPRATEFTKNPFHLDFGNTASGTSRPVSTSTEADQWASAHAMDVDPRSPVQKGSSPIVRNIWDVL